MASRIIQIEKPGSCDGEGFGFSMSVITRI
jgi:hypothetical protein